MLNFPQYTKSETIAILRKDLPTGEEENLDLYMRFVDLVYDVFQRNCKDLNEIRHLIALLFPLYIKPVKEGKSKCYSIHVIGMRVCVLVNAQSGKMLKTRSPKCLAKNDRRNI